jgi:hypothetical protein
MLAREDLVWYSNSPNSDASTVGAVGGPLNRVEHGGSLKLALKESFGWGREKIDKNINRNGPSLRHSIAFSDLAMKPFGYSVSFLFLAVKIEVVGAYAIEL